LGGKNNKHSKLGVGTMSTKNPIKHYLAQSVHTNYKIVLLALFIILIAGVITVIVRNIPAIAGVISEHISTEMVVDFPVKFLGSGSRGRPRHC